MRRMADIPVLKTYTHINTNINTNTNTNTNATKTFRMSIRVIPTTKKAQETQETVVPARS